MMELLKALLGDGDIKEGEAEQGDSNSKSSKLLQVKKRDKGELVGRGSGKRTSVLKPPPPPPHQLPPFVVTVRCGHAWSPTVSRGASNPAVRVKTSLTCETLVFNSSLFQTNTVSAH